MNTVVRFTYDDLQQFPEDGKRRELVEGELYTMPSPSPEHQDIVGEFFFELKLFLRSNPLGRAFVAPVDVIFHIDDVVIPDVMFVSSERQELISKRGVEGAPDLVVEVVSPSSVKRDLEVKRKLCQREGVIVYIAIDSDNQHVHVWDGDNSFVLDTANTLTISVLPGFSLLVSKLFEKA
jgi:Uma2 family endonuclease